LPKLRSKYWTHRFSFQATKPFQKCTQNFTREFDSYCNESVVLSLLCYANFNFICKLFFFSFFFSASIWNNSIKNYIAMKLQNNDKKHWTKYSQNNLSHIIFLHHLCCAVWKFGKQCWALEPNEMGHFNVLQFWRQLLTKSKGYRIPRKQGLHCTSQILNKVLVCNINQYMLHPEQGKPLRKFILDLWFWVWNGFPTVPSSLVVGGILVL